jgi:hypothetical protein
LFDRVKDALLIVPGFHLATCLIYLFFYHSAFGGGLAYFAEPADIFSVSLADVAPAYVWLGLGLILSHFAFRRNWRQNEFRLDTMTEDDRVAVAPKANECLRFFTLELV